MVEDFRTQYALSCPKGGFTILRHNEIRDLTANVLSEVCHNVNVEPALQPLTGEVFSGASAIKDDAARLDIAADGFWGDHRERVYCDVRIFNPLAPSNNQSMSACYRKHEKMKKRAYEQRVREVEHGSFTPLVFSATGGMGDLPRFFTSVASNMAEKSGSPDFSAIIAWLRTRL